MNFHLIFTAASLLVSAAAAASQDMCYNLAYGPAGQCNAASTDTGYLETFLMQDQLLANCTTGGVFQAIAEYVDTNGATSTVPALNTVSIANTYVGPLLFSYNIPISTIGAAQPVKVTVLATNTLPVGTLSRVVSFTLSHAPTVSYLTETISGTSTYAQTSTSIFRITNTYISTYTPSSRSTVTRTGYTTSLAPRPTTTSIYTLTPSVRTIVSLAVIAKTTVTLDCNPTLRPSTQSATKTAIVKRQAVPTQFVVPFCSAPVTTTITAGTVQLYNTTTTYTTTLLSTIRTTTIELASSPSVFLAPTTTLTLTPRESTSRIAIIAARPTVYLNSTLLTTSTIYARGGKTKVCTPPTASIDFLATGRISNSLSASSSQATSSPPPQVLTTVTTTTYLPSNSPAFTSTIPQAGTIPGKVIIGSPSASSTFTTLSTTSSAPAGPIVTSTVTSTSFFAGGSAYTSTVTGLYTKTIVIGYVQTYNTVYVTSGTVQQTSTLVPASGTKVGTVQVLYPTPDLSCGNQGLTYAMYNNTFYNGDNAYSSFNATFFKTSSPYFTGSTSRMGISNTAGNVKTKVYDDSPSIFLPYLAINHRGFVYARTTGSYTFTCPFSDDVNLFWIGTNALSSWTRANANLEQNYSGGTSTKSFKMDLVQGQYYPFRVLFGNGQGYAGFHFNMYGPDGIAIESGTGSSSDYIVNFACDGSTPSFPAFGAGG